MIGLIFAGAPPSSANPNPPASKAVCDALLPTNGVGSITAASLRQCIDLLWSSITTTPATTVIGHLAAWGDTAGTVLTDVSPITAIQTTNYTAPTVSAPCNQTVPLAGNTTFTFTLNAASGYPDGCRIRVTNADVYTGVGTGRGKFLAINGLSFTNAWLYPGQSTEFTAINNVWVETGYGQRQRWKPGVNVTFFINLDGAVGSDTLNDGLVSSAGGPWNTPFHAWLMTGYVDSTAGGVSQIKWSSTGTWNGAVDGDTLHAAGPVVGGDGNAAILWEGNNTTHMVATGGAPCFAFFNHITFELSGIDCQNSSADCIDASHGALVILLTNPFNCNSGNAINFYATDPGTEIQFNNAVSVGPSVGSANYSAIFFASAGALIDVAQQITINNTVSINVYSTVVSDRGAEVRLGGTWIGTATGFRYNCQHNALISGTNAVANYIPGNAAGTASGGCQYF